MITASGQSSLFMITRSVALPGSVAPAGHWKLYPKATVPKEIWDPQNVFALNQNIPPSPAEIRLQPMHE
jgi:hypothetical protein